MLVQLVGSSLSVISITILKDLDRSFAGTLNPAESIGAAFYAPVEEFPGKSIPLRFEDFFVPIHL